MGRLRHDRLVPASPSCLIGAAPDLMSISGRCALVLRRRSTRRPCGGHRVPQLPWHTRSALVSVSPDQVGRGGTLGGTRLHGTTAKCELHAAGDNDVRCGNGRIDDASLVWGMRAATTGQPLSESGAHGVPPNASAPDTSLSVENYVDVGPAPDRRRARGRGWGCGVERIQ